MRSRLIVLMALAFAVGGCDRLDPNQRRADADHPRQDYTSSLLSRMSAADIERLTTPPAPPQRGPIPPDANYADPATNPALAFGKGSSARSPVPPPGSDHSPDGIRLAVMAQDAAAKAPDTASADEARRKVYQEHAAKAAPSTASSGEGPAKS